MVGVKLKVPSNVFYEIIFLSYYHMTRKIILKMIKFQPFFNELMKNYTQLYSKISKKFQTKYVKLNFYFTLLLSLLNVTAQVF